RPSMTRLREAARLKAFDVVLVHALDRIARSIEAQAILFGELKRHGITVEFASMHAEDTKEYRMLVTFLGGIAEYEREAIRDRTLYGKRKKASSGLVVAPGNAPYGYAPDPTRPGHLILNESEAATVRLIYRWCLDEGKSLNQIVNALHRLGTPARKGEWGT